MRCVLSLLTFSVLAGAATAQAPEPLVKKVKTSIHRGVDYLIRKQHADGTWEGFADQGKITHYRGGMTGLAVLALLNCDGIVDEPLEQKRKQAIKRGLDAVRRYESVKVYDRALQTMALAEAPASKANRAIIERNVQWLLAARVFVNGRFIGWEYEKRPTSRSTDASNSQYALLALWYGRQAGVQIERKVWGEIQDYYVRSQNQDGSWVYTDDPDYGPRGEKGPSATMTVAGLCGLLISGMELNGGREQWKAGRVTNCGIYGDDLPLAKAQDWIAKNFKIDLSQRAYYHLYGLERAGRLSGMRFFGAHDWYREGCQFITAKQDADGSWPSRDGWDRWPHVNTSFALLFLSKGRTPVVISKVVHGNWPRREDDTDWNNDRNDLRHLTDYVSKTDLFGKKPIAWQTYDIRRAIEAHLDKNNVLNAEQETAIVADMRQAPILYITGHQSPLRRFQDVETKLIKRYVESGGFIFAEACCGDPGFDKGFKEWVKANWDQDLVYIESTHPVWTCTDNHVQPGQPYKLMALQVGCRTVMLYSPQDLSCHWESNQRDGIGRPAFWLGANIIAYATGRVPPQPRLTPIDIASDNPMKDLGKRGSFVVRQLRHNADWQPAPRAMSNLLEHVYKVTGLDVKPRAVTLSLGDELDVKSSKFIYMHGRGDFRIDPKHLEPLNFTLRYGGLLFADACCGDPAFDKSFRKFARDLFPNEKLQRVPANALNHNGEELTAKNIRCRIQASDAMLPMALYLEGIQVDGRWVVLYSKYDIGCALERNTSSDCVGYDPESALKIATAAVRYATRP